MSHELGNQSDERGGARAGEGSPQVATDTDLAAFLGRFARSEAKDVVRARIHAAIDQGVAPLSWPLRIAARSGLRFVAEMPDWVAIERSGELLSVTFSSGVSLRAELGGAPRSQQLPAGVHGNVRHFWQAERLCTEIVSEHGTIRNEYERVSADELIGHASLVSPYFPLPVHYDLRLRRM